MSDLAKQIDTMTKLVWGNPKSGVHLKALAELHLVRGTLKGDLDELGTALDETKRALSLDAKSPEIAVTRAEVLVAVQRFGEARAAIEKARELTADEDAVGALEQAIDLGQADYAKAHASIRAAAAKRRTMTTVARLALLHRDLGEIAAADRAFDEAEDLITDSSSNPVPVAWLEVQRGRHLAGLGRADEAIVFFRRAVRRLPAYGDAIMDLSATLRVLGNDEEAKRHCDEFLRRADDPEAGAMLARILRARGRGDPDTLKWHAMWRWNNLMGRFPEATLARAADFFLADAGEPLKAAELARKNLAFHPDSDGYVTLARAELASGHPSEARDAIDKALAMPVQSARLFWTGARAYALTGEDAKSKELAARAKTRNPMIDRLEPPLVPAGSVSRSAPDAAR